MLIIPQIQTFCGYENNKFGCAYDENSNLYDLAVRIAYSEAWASVFAGIAQSFMIQNGLLDSNINMVGDSVYSEINMYNFDYNNSNCRMGEATEGSIMGLLWDIYDINVDDSNDGIAIGAISWWNLTCDSSIRSCSDLVTKFMSAYSSEEEINNLGERLEYYKIGPGNVTTNINQNMDINSTPQISWEANGISTI